MQLTEAIRIVKAAKEIVNQCEKESDYTWIFVDGLIRDSVPKVNCEYQILSDAVTAVMRKEIE